MRGNLLFLMDDNQAESFKQAASLPEEGICAIGPLAYPSVINSWQAQSTEPQGRVAERNFPGYKLKFSRVRLISEEPNQ